MTLQQNIYRDALYAVAVIDFLGCLPDTLARHLFRHILDQSFEQMSVFPREICSDQLCSAILDCYNHLMNGASYAFSCLGDALCLGKEVKTTSIKQPEMLKILTKNSRQKRLRTSPETIRIKMLCAYECFTQSHGERIKDVDAYVKKPVAVLMQLNESYNDTDDVYRYNLDRIPDYVSENPFESLGYQTFYDQFVSPFDNPAEMSIDKKKIEKFITWYCRGHVIDHVLDFIYLNHIPALSRSMMSFLRKKCESSAELFEVVKERHAVMKDIDNSIPDLKFVGPRLDIPDKGIEYIPIKLPAIIQTIEGDEPISTKQLSIIFDSLKKEGYVSDEDGRTFVRVFSGTKTYIGSGSTITWKKSQQDLARFLFLASGLKKVSDNYTKTAATVFRRRNGEPCKLETLSRRYSIKEDEDDIMLKIFTKAEIQR